MTTALFMPGQGLHYVGMGKKLAEVSPEAAAVFAEADEALGFSLSSLCWEGPEETLTLTEHAQPAILTHSIAALRALQAREEVSFDAVAGHSLGEWTALVAAGALSLNDAVRLVRLRGRYMQEAVPSGLGAMSAVIGLESAEIEEICRDVEAKLRRQVVSVATLNGRNNIVVSGHAGAVRLVGEIARSRGAIKVSALSVSAPFHCSLMEPAALHLSDALAGVVFQPPEVQVWSTVTAFPILGVGEISELLVRQLTEPVLWQPTVEAMFATGVDRGIALGPAKALKGMIRRISRGIKVQVVDELD